jgi:hypothetical protein
VKILADNPAFTANLEYHSYAVAAPTGLVEQGKLSYVNGSTRFETFMSAGDPNLPLVDASILQQLGMDQLITISRPDKQMNYSIYPRMKAYVQRPIPASELAAFASDYQLDVTRAGDENVLGQNCVKNTVVVTGPDGVAHQLTVWNATDLNDFPIKIQSDESGPTVFMLFRDLNLSMPDAAQFVPPVGYQKYSDFTQLMASRSGNLGAK